MCCTLVTKWGTIYYVAIRVRTGIMQRLDVAKCHNLPICILRHKCINSSNITKQSRSNCRSFSAALYLPYFTSATDALPRFTLICSRPTICGGCGVMPLPHQCKFNNHQFGLTVSLQHSTITCRMYSPQYNQYFLTMTKESENSWCQLLSRVCWHS